LHELSSQDEDKQVEEFARKLEYISKQPPMRFVNQGKRRRKLKPNVSHDWIQTLQKQLKTQRHDKENTHIDSQDSESIGAVSFNSNPAEGSEIYKKMRLKDVTADSIQVRESLSDIQSQRASNQSTGKKKK
jgi:hypothetical protein